MGCRVSKRGIQKRLFLWLKIAKSHQEVPKSHFQSQFSMSRTIRFFFIYGYLKRKTIQPKLLIIFPSKNIDLGFYWHFLITLFLKALYFPKWCLMFEGLALCLFPKYNNFAWLCWKNQSNFYPALGNFTTHITIMQNSTLHLWTCYDTNANKL